MVEAKIKKATAEIKAIVLARGSQLMHLYGVGPVVAARILADVGDVSRFADRNRFASWTGTAPLDVSSGEHNRHRLSRAGNRRVNHMLHIAAVTQLRHDPAGRAYYRRKSRRARSRWKRCAASNAGSPMRSTASSSPTPPSAPVSDVARVREGTAGRLKNPARSTCPRTSTFGSATSRTRKKTLRPAPRPGSPREHPRDSRLTTEGSRCAARSQGVFVRSVPNEDRLRVYTDPVEDPFRLVTPERLT